jgi:hydroxymethylpyrimidine/phosphomethylpyrimidine kinase
MLTIAGFDPSSGAGITADLMVFASFGCFGTACVTALTVQSTTGVRASEAVAPQLVSATLACLESDLPVDGVKIGMLATRQNVLAVCEFLGRVRARGGHVPVVLDPVLRSSSGRELLSADGVEALRERLLPLVNWVTPNLAELGELTSLNVRKREEMEAASRGLVERYRTLGVVAKGGHLEDCADDLVIGADGRSTWLPGERLISRSTHGTGCAFSSALACGLALGGEAAESAGAAKAFVRGAIECATPIGAGNGPMNLLWSLRKLRCAG